MSRASGASSVPKAGPPGPPESVSANIARSLGFLGDGLAPVSRKTGARNRGREPAA